MDMTIIIAFASICALILGAATIICWRMVDVIRGTLKTTGELTQGCLREMQVNHARVVHKMEDWHERDKQATIGHLERVLEFATTRDEDKVSIARANGVERHEERIAGAAHSTNERVADLQESIHRDVLKQGVKEEIEELEKRIPVELSKIHKDRAAAQEGRIPQRHG